MNNETCISSPNKITSILDHPIPLMIGAAGIILLITCLSLIIWKCCCKSERRKEDEVIVEDEKDTIKPQIPQNSIEKSNKHVKNNRKPQHNIINIPRKVRNIHLPQLSNTDFDSS
ncbi:uncharacterized protein LOC143238974 isoform X3 [Tachypleus tridentatus]|uniref:uncharacterized protein LOC143238974 isoform X3 n=1 Tax=Tachypleus tridentatus TaxID=6853 RepID=UPI003FCF0E32